MKKTKLILTCILCCLLPVLCIAQSYPTASWLKANKGSGGTDVGYGVAYDASGNMYVAGYFQGEFNPDNTGATTTWMLTSNGGTDMYLAKYSSTGSLVWAFGIGGTNADVLLGIAVDGSGNVYVAGYIQGTTSTNIDADPSSNTNNVTGATGSATADQFVAKYDGTLTPTSTSFYKWAFTTGGTSTDLLNSIAVDGSGNVYVAGYITGTTSDNIDADPSSNTNNVTGATGTNSMDQFVAKYDGTLTPSSTSFYKWAFTTGGTSSDQLNGIAVDGSGNVYVAGFISGTTSDNIDADPSSNTNNVTGATVSSSNDHFVAKYDGTLTPSSTSFYKWAFTTGGTGPDQLKSIAVDGSGNVYVAGYIYGTTSINIDADPSSNTNNITGATATNTYDHFVAKYDGTLTPSGTSFYKWAFTTGGAGTDELNGIAVDGSGNVYVAGYIFGTTSINIDADPSSNTNNVTGATTTSNYDHFVAKYDGTLTPSGTSFYKWAFVTGGFSTDAFYGVAVGNNRIYLSGSSASGEYDVDPSTSVNTITPNYTSDDIVAMIYDNTVTPSFTSFYKAGVWAGNGGTNAIVTATAIDAAGNVYTAGYFGGTCYLGNTALQSKGSTDMFLAKYNSSGSLAWAFSMGGISIDQISSIAVDASGNVYVAGYIVGTTSTNIDADPSSGTNNVTGATASTTQDHFIAKYDGTLTPSSTSFYKWAFTTGGNSHEQLNSIAVDGSGNVYVAGYIKGTTSTSIDADPSSNTNYVTGATTTNSQDHFVAKYDGTLTPSSTSFYKWAFTTGGTNPDVLTGIAVDGSGNIYVAGYIQGATSISIDADPSSNANNVRGATSTNSQDHFVAKYDGTLTPSSTSFYKWAFTTGGTSIDRLTSIAVDGSSNVYVAGYITGTTSTNIDADPTSSTNNVTGATTIYDLDHFVAKYDGTLTPSSTSFYKWAFTTGGVSSDLLNAITVDGSGNVYVAGYTTGTTSTNIDADPSSNTNNVTGATSTSSNDHFVAKYDGTLTPSSTSFYKWAYTAGGTSPDQLNSIAVRDGIFATGGYFTGSTVNFQPGTGTSSLSSAQNGSAQSLFLGSYLDGYVWNGTTWSPATPTSVNNAIINSSVAPTSFSCNNLTVIDGNALNTGVSDVVTISGNLSNQGRGVTGTGTLTFNKAGTANLTGDTIKHEGTILVASGCTLATNNKLKLLSNAANTGRIGTSAGAITGKVTVQRYIPGKRAFRFLGHPFAVAQPLTTLTDNIDITGNGGSGNGFTSTSTNNPSAFWFDASVADNSTTGINPGWVPFTHTDGLGANAWNPYQMMRVLVRGAIGEGLAGGSYTPTATTLDMTDSINQGNQLITLTKGSGSVYVSCGNPFASGIQMNTVSIGSNVRPNYYAWDAGTGVGAYVTNPWSLSYILPSYAAFFTQVIATDNITIKESDKVAGGAGLFKTTAPANWVELLISDTATKWDRLLINLDDNAMDVQDNQDAVKLYNPGLDFFTLSKDDVRLAIDVRPYTDSASIPLGLTAYNRYSKYVIKTGMYDIPVGTKLFLHDKYLNTKQEMKQGFEYWFDVTTDTLSQGNQRFEINMVGKPTGIIVNSNNIARIQLMPNPATNQVKVAFDNVEGAAQVKLMSVTGQVLYQTTASGQTGSVSIPLLNIPAGIYLVELKSNNAIFTEKLIKE